MAPSKMKRICILHGYMLEGSGSNIYVQNMARAYTEKGYDVTLVCQERVIKDYPFISSHYQFDQTNMKYHRVSHRKPKTSGTCQIYNPFIGNLLPVYVADKFKYFKKSKVFPKLSQRELNHYIAANVTALSTLLCEKRFDFIHANHVMMSPYIACLATKNINIPYVVSCHGSALNYVVKKSKRLKVYAIQGLKGAHRIFAPSTYFNQLLHEQFSRHIKGLKSKIVIVPDGVNTDEFMPILKIKLNHINRLNKVLRDKLKIHNQGKISSKPGRKYNMYHLDRDIVQRLNSVSWNKDPVVMFVGKLIHTKGPQILISAIPDLIKKYPDMKFVFVGYGKERERLEKLVRANADNVFFTGLLEHAELKHLLPLADILVVPSLFPETFGMIAIEGMASGVPTLVTYQSGLKDLHIAISTVLKKGVKLKKMHLQKRLPQTLSQNIDSLIKSGATRNVALKHRLHAYADKHYSWSKIAQQCIMHARM